MLLKRVLQGGCGKTITYRCTISSKNDILSVVITRKGKSAMRKYKEVTITKNEIDRVICNGCGKELTGYTDYLSVDKLWGYGTAYDGQTHRFDLCEECYNKLVAGFVIGVEED
jgi:ribosomal-protein-alanine N-acetyltransferase